MELSKEDLFQISKFSSKYEALDFMRKRIPIEQMRTLTHVYRYEIQLDILYNLIDFCMLKGFRLDQIIKCIRLQNDMLEYIKKSTTKLSSMLDYLIDNLKQNSDCLNEKNMIDLIDYFNLSILSHFNLYKYVFCFDRDDSRLNETKVLMMPKEEILDNKLSNAKPLNLWEYEQKLNDLNLKEKLLKEKFNQENKNLLLEEENAKNLIKFIQNDAYGNKEPLNEQVMKNLIDQISIPMIEIAKKIVKNDMIEAKSHFDLQSQRQAIINIEEKAKRSTPTSARNKKK